MYTQKSPVLHRPSRTVHALEVRPFSSRSSVLPSQPHPLRQTVFYTPNTLTISAGESITGTLSCAPNARNNRDLDISITYKTTGEPETTMHYKMCVTLRRCCLISELPFLQTLIGCQVVICICPPILCFLSFTNAQPTLVSRVDIVTTMHGVLVYLAHISYNAHPLVLLFTLSPIPHIRHSDRY